MKSFRSQVAALGILSAAVGLVVSVAAQSPAIPIDPDDIGGVVTSPNGPEAGVWVIAETTDLPTKFTPIVVTDDRGRYVVPDLPKAKYSWSWLSLLKVSAASEFSGTGPSGNGIGTGTNMRTPGDFVRSVKAGGFDRVPPVGHAGHARNSKGAWDVSLAQGRVGAPHSVRSGWPSLRTRLIRC